MNGFTLLEICVAMVMVTLVIGFGYQAYRTVLFRKNANVAGNTERSSRYRFVHWLSEDMQTTRHAERNEKGELVMQRDSLTRIYFMDEKQQYICTGSDTLRFELDMTEVQFHAWPGTGVIHSLVITFGEKDGGNRFRISRAIDSSEILQYAKTEAP